LFCSVREFDILLNSGKVKIVQSANLKVQSYNAEEENDSALRKLQIASL
jgi:hypothetical protein